MHTNLFISVVFIEQVKFKSIANFSFSLYKHLVVTWIKINVTKSCSDCEVPATVSFTVLYHNTYNVPIKDQTIRMSFITQRQGHMPHTCDQIHQLTHTSSYHDTLISYHLVTT